MRDGIAGLCGLALSLAWTPPRLPRLCFRSHRFRCLLIGRNVANESGVVVVRCCGSPAEKSHVPKFLDDFLVQVVMFCVVPYVQKAVAAISCERCKH